MNINPPKICECGSTEFTEVCEGAVRLFRWNGTAFTKVGSDGVWYWECTVCGKELSQEAFDRVYEAL